MRVGAEGVHDSSSVVTHEDNIVTIFWLTVRRGLNTSAFNGGGARSIIVIRRLVAPCVIIFKVWTSYYFPKYKV